jgi:hypothetical protein
VATAKAHLEVREHDPLAPISKVKTPYSSGKVTHKQQPIQGECITTVPLLQQVEYDVFIRGEAQWMGAGTFSGTASAMTGNNAGGSFRGFAPAATRGGYINKNTTYMFIEDRDDIK